MRRLTPYYFPVSGAFLVALAVVLGLVFVLIELDVLRYAYTRLGVGHRAMVLLLLLSLLGSYVNLPVAVLRGERIVSERVITVYGSTHVVPAVEQWPGTVIAVNLGGAVTPAALSVYLIAHHGLYLPAVAGVSLVTLIVHRVARPQPGVGIVVPMLIPPLLSVAVALLLHTQATPALAYISGTLGSLIGGDLLNLGKIRGLGAPVASIGGAGKFDGTFVTGIVAVLLA